MNRFVAIILLCTLAFSTGCEEDVNPFIGTELPYTVWGFVNPKEEVQAVRVFTIDPILQLIPADPLDATVSIVDVDDNQRFNLEDSTLELPNGDFRHIFYGNFGVESEKRYRIEVERSDGIISRSADVRVPAPITITVLPPNLNAISEIVLPVAFDGNPPSLPRIDATYLAYTINSQSLRVANNSVSIPYAGTPVFRDGQWLLDIDLRQDFVDIRADFNEKEIEGLICIDAIRLDVHVTNEEWRSPIGDFDPDVLVEPGTLSNIENGFGFFGAGYVESVSWLPPATMLVRAGFFDCATG